jgi:hypothetical protein
MFGRSEVLHDRLPLIDVRSDTFFADDATGAMAGRQVGMDPLSSSRSSVRSLAPSHNAPRTDLATVPTSARPTPSDGATFRDVVGRGAQVLAAEAQGAITRLPGGPLLAAAVRPSIGGSVGGAALPASVSSVVGGSSSGGTAVGGSPLVVNPNVIGGGAGAGAGVGSSSLAATPAEGPGAAGSTLPGSPSTSVESQLAASQDMNLYYLQLQEAMSAENRSYSACSNVLKARHDTVKNAIGNIR